MPIDPTVPMQYTSKLGCRVDPTFPDNTALIQEALDLGYAVAQDIPGLLPIRPIHIPNGNAGWLSGIMPGRRGVAKGLTGFTEYEKGQKELITINKVGSNTGVGKQVTVEDLALVCKYVDTIAIGIYGAEAAEIRNVGVYGGSEGIRIHALTRVCGVTIGNFFADSVATAINIIGGVTACGINILGGSINKGNIGIYADSWFNQLLVQGMTLQAQTKAGIELKHSNLVLASSYLECLSMIPALLAKKGSNVYVSQASRLTIHAIDADSRIEVSEGSDIGYSITP